MNDLYTTIYEKLSVLQSLLKRQEVLSQERFGPFADTSRGQGRILAMLKIQPEIATKDLAYLLGIRQQSLNELLNKLEKGGYVTRKPSEKDRRVMLVCLTEKGRQTEAGQNESYAFLDCLSADELETFGQYLDKVIASLRKETEGSETGPDDAWMHQSRGRMDAGSFEQLMSMHARAFGSFGPEHGPKPPHEEGVHPRGPKGRPEGKPGRGCGFGPEGFDGPRPGAGFGRPEGPAGFEDMPQGGFGPAGFGGPFEGGMPEGFGWPDGFGGMDPFKKTEDAEADSKKDNQ